MDTGTAVVGIGVIISLFGYLEIIRRDLRSDIKEVRQASEKAHKEINEKLNAIEVTQATHSERFNTVDERFNTVDEKFNTMGERFSAVDERFNKVDEQFNKVDEQFNKVDERFNKVDERFNAIQTQIKSVDDKVDRLRNS